MRRRRDISRGILNRFGNRVQDRLDCTHCGHVRDWQSETSDSVFLRVTKWSPGCVLTDAIARELATENVGAEYRCEECGERGTTTRSWRYLRLAPCLFISVDRTHFDMGMPTPQKRLGRVKLPDTMSLHTAHGTVQYKLVAAACHRGAQAGSGHWLTWRRGHTVGQPSVSWIIDDDERRRLPSGN